MTDRPSSEERPVRIAYVLHRFPYRTETFIVGEMLGLLDRGVELTIFSLLRPEHEVIGDDVARLMNSVRYAPDRRLDTWKANVYFVVRSPVRYIRSLGQLVGQTFREPLVLARALLLFPRSVEIAREAEKEGIQHVHAHFVWLEGLAAGVIRKLTGIGFSIHPHAFGLFGRNRRDVVRQLENADGVIAISRYHQDFISRLSPRLRERELPIVHCGVDTNRFAPRRDPNNDVARILSVGRAVEKKGHEYLIRACALLHDRGMEFHLTIVTGGGSPATLRDRIAEKGLGSFVDLVDQADEVELIEHLRRTDVFVLACVVAKSGDRDGVPVSLMEAMSCEVPVVTTPVAGIPELVEDGVTGLLAEERDVEGLAAAVSRLLTDSGLRASLGAAGRQRVVEQFNIERTAGQMASFLSAMAAD